MYLHIDGLERDLVLDERYMEAFSVVVNWE
jgi:hypothetical protein